MAKRKNRGGQRDTLTLDEYLKERKIQDRMNEFDLEKQKKNLKLSVDYCFDYFNDYVDRPEVIRKNREKAVKVKSYSDKLTFYSPDIQRWMTTIFREHNIRIDCLINKNIKDPTYLIYTNASEYNKLSHTLITKLGEGHPYLYEQTEEIKSFLHQYHDYINISSEKTVYKNDHYKDACSNKLNDWIDDVKGTWHIDLSAFAEWYIQDFIKSPELWDAKKPFYDEYEYDLENSKDLMRINKLYAKTRNKPFIEGHNAELLVLLLMTYNGDWDNVPESILVKAFSDLGDGDASQVPRKG